MKKFNYKLTIILVSLFISMILCALSNLNQYCLFFGLIMLGVSSALFVWYKYDDIKRREAELQIEMEGATLAEYKAVYKPLKKEMKRLIVGFGGLAIFMIIIAFVLLFA